MRSRPVFPVFVFLAIGAFLVLGTIILGSAIMAGSESSTDVTAQAVTESWWETGSMWFYGLAVLIVVLAIAMIFYIFFIR